MIRGGLSYLTCVAANLGGVLLFYNRDHFKAAGFEYLLIPVQTECWEAWITAAMMIGRSQAIRMLVAVRPGYVNPFLAAKMIATFDQLSGGRICVNLIAGQRLVPELLQREAEPGRISRELLALLDDREHCQMLIARFDEMHRQLRCGAAGRAADAVLAVLGRVPEPPP